MGWGWRGIALGAGYIDGELSSGGDVTLALDEVEVKDDLRAGGVFVFFCGEGFEVDGTEAAKNLIAAVDQDGTATRGDAVLGKKDDEAGEEGENVGSGLEIGERAEEFGSEGRVGTVVLGTHVTRTKAVALVED